MRSAARRLDARRKRMLMVNVTHMTAVADGPARRAASAASCRIGLHRVINWPRSLDERRPSQLSKVSYSL